MKKLFCFFYLIVLIGINSYGQENIKSLIKDNLNSRYTSVEIVSITPDFCPDMRNLFSLSMSLTLVASECKLNIVKTFLKYDDKEISYEKTKELCQKEVDRIKALADEWLTAYFNKSEKCLFVRYRYGNAQGIKTTVEDYYSLDESRYKEGNYPYLKKEYDEQYGFNFYKEVANKYKDLLLELASE